MTDKIRLILPVILFAFYWCNIKEETLFRKLQLIFLALIPFLCENDKRYIYILYFMNIIIIFYYLLELLYYRKIKINYTFIWYFLFLAYIIFSGITRGVNREWFSGVRNYIFFSLGTFCVYYNVKESKNNLVKIAKINISVIFIIALIQTIEGYIKYHYWIRASAPMVAPNYFAMIIFLQLYLLGLEKEEEFNKINIYKFLGLICIIMSQSVTGLLGMIVWLSDIKAIRYRRKGIYASFFTCIILGVLGLVTLRIYNASLFNNLFYSQGDRMIIWAIYINMFQTNPLFGIGYNMAASRAKLYVFNLPQNKVMLDMFQMQMNSAGENFLVASHNELIKLLTETGVVGTIIFLIYIFTMYKKIDRRNRMDIVFFIICMLFFITQNPLQGYCFWLLFLLPLFEDKSENKLILETSYER